MAPALLRLYDASDPAGPVVRTEERISALERDLARLESVVERLVLGMDAERQAMKESRQEVWIALKDLGDKMERSVTGLADEMKKLADRNAAIDSQVLAKQSQALGAISATRWIIGTAIAVSGLVFAYHAGQEDKTPAPEKSSNVAGFILP